MTIGEGEVVRGDGVKSIVRIIQFTYSLINEFSNKRMTIGEGEVVRGDRADFLCPNFQVSQFTNLLIKEFSNQRMIGSFTSSIVLHHSIFCASQMAGVSPNTIL